MRINQFFIFYNEIRNSKLWFCIKGLSLLHGESEVKHLNQGQIQYLDILVVPDLNLKGRIPEATLS